MKTEVTIPDPVFAAAERLAKRERISRSDLYAKALRDYVKPREANGITRKLNRVYARQPSRLDPSIERMQSEAIGEDRW